MERLLFLHAEGLSPENIATVFHRQLNWSTVQLGT